MSHTRVGCGHAANPKASRPSSVGKTRPVITEQRLGHPRRWKTRDRRGMPLVVSSDIEIIRMADAS